MNNHINSNNNGSSINSVLLNKELLTQIFNHIGYSKQDIFNIRLVNSMWRVSCNPLFFKQVKFIGNTVLNPDEIPSTLSQDFIKEKEAIIKHYEGNFEFVEEFECYGWSNQFVINFFANNFPNIKTLHLRSLTDLDGSINNSENLFPHLKHLTVEYVVLGNIPPSNILFQNNIKNLKTLDLIHMTVDSQDYPKVFGFTKNLEKLNISYMPYNPNIIGGIANYLGNLKKLTLLLHWVNNTDSPHDIFKNCSKLEDIKLSIDCNLSESLYFIANNNPLVKKSICLIENRYLDIPALINVFERCNNLESLEFQNCPTLTLEAIESIAKNLPNLKTFKFEQPNLSPTWVALIFKKFENLNHLHLIALPPISLNLPSSWPNSNTLKILYLRGIQFLPPFDLVSLDFPNLESCEINGKRLL